MESDRMQLSYRLSRRSLDSTPGLARSGARNDLLVWNRCWFSNGMEHNISQNGGRYAPKDPRNRSMRRCPIIQAELYARSPYSLLVHYSMKIPFTE